MKLNFSRKVIIRLCMTLFTLMLVFLIRELPIDDVNVGDLYVELTEYYSEDKVYTHDDYIRIEDKLRKNIVYGKNHERINKLISLRNMNFLLNEIYLREEKKASVEELRLEFKITIDILKEF